MMTVGSLFSGVGGFDLGLERVGMKVLWQSEIDPYASKILKKHWPKVKNYGDITKIKGTELPTVDLICGGFPCQNLSYAGKGEGLDGSRSGLFFEMSRVIGEAKPKYVLLENVPGIVTNGLGRVMQELRFQGYTPLRPVLVEAASVGAPHKRERIFILAYANFNREEWNKSKNRKGRGVKQSCEDVADTNGRRGSEDHVRTGWNAFRGGSEVMADTHSELSSEPRGTRSGRAKSGNRGLQGTEWNLSDNWISEPDVGRVAHGISHRVDRLRCLGNAVVPQVASLLGRMIIEFDKTR